MMRLFDFEWNHNAQHRMITGLVLLALVLGIVVFTSPASAQGQGKRGPDGQTPSEEEVCDDVEGGAFGICNAYCEATDCGDGLNYANFRACEALQMKWERKTGVAELPCDCDETSVFDPAVGCTCGHDLVVHVLAHNQINCTGAGETFSCDHEADIEVENLGSQDIVGSFDVRIEATVGDGTALDVIESFPAGLGAGVTEQRLAVPLGSGGNCFNPNCEVLGTADVGTVIEECNENNNTDLLEILG